MDDRVVLQFLLFRELSRSDVPRPRRRRRRQRDSIAIDIVFLLIGLGFQLSWRAVVYIVSRGALGVYDIIARLVKAKVQLKLARYRVCLP